MTTRDCDSDHECDLYVQNNQILYLHELNTLMIESATNASMEPTSQHIITADCKGTFTFQP